MGLKARSEGPVKPLTAIGGFWSPTPSYCNSVFFYKSHGNIHFKKIPVSPILGLHMKISNTKQNVSGWLFFRTLTVRLGPRTFLALSSFSLELSVLFGVTWFSSSRRQSTSLAQDSSLQLCWQSHHGLCTDWSPWTGRRQDQIRKYQIQNQKRKSEKQVCERLRWIDPQNIIV